MTVMTMNRMDYSIFEPKFMMLMRSVIASTLFKSRKRWTKNLMRYFKQNPRHLYEVDPVLFERIIGNIFERLGFEVSYTGRTRDGGIDFFALDKNKNFRQKYIVQCKRYRSDRKISVEYIRELYGIKNVIPATKAILATTSFFTPDAMNWETNLSGTWT